MRNHTNHHSEIERKIREYNPHAVGITCSYTHQWGNARAIADLVKKVDKNIPVVMGGVHITGLPEDALLDCPADYAVVRQADFSFVELLDCITNREGAKKDVAEIAGIAFRREGRVWQTFPRPYMKDIDAIAIPDLSLVNLPLYNGEFHSAGRRQTLDGYILYGFTSIGCNTGCNFCAIPASQGGFRKMNEQRLDEYLKYITSQGVREFLVEDDHLMHDPEWARHVFKKMKEHKLYWVEEGGVGLFNLIALLPEVDESFVRNSAVNPKIFNNTLEAKRAGLDAEQLIKEMGESGCYSLYLAVESANLDSLERAHKPSLNSIGEYTKKIVGLFNKYGIKTTCGLMLGFIESNHAGISIESREQIINTIKYGKMLYDAGASFINPFIVTPLPGAPNFRGLDNSLGNSLLRNTDSGYSHEFATIDAPNGAWTKDELNLLRVYALIHGNGIHNYKEMLETGTWPVR
ncbi:MAG: cobalamin-dependent protein [Nanoarchaeota archaeon]